MTHQQFTFVANDLSSTDRIGAALAEVLPAGTTVALEGTLGAGKTRLVQALAVAYGLPVDSVVSPTFVLCQEYHGRQTLIHMDAYRIADDDEFLQLGVDEYFDSDAIVLIEWAERVAACLPPACLKISIDILGPTQRSFAFMSTNPTLDSVIVSLAKALSCE